MNTLAHWDPRLVDGTLDWLESLFTVPRPPAGHPPQAADHATDGSHMLRAGLPADDPDSPRTGERDPR
jgi:hypothetical protein